MNDRRIRKLKSGRGHHPNLATHTKMQNKTTIHCFLHHGSWEIYKLTNYRASPFHLDYKVLRAATPPPTRTKVVHVAKAIDQLVTLSKDLWWHGPGWMPWPLETYAKTLPDLLSLMQGHKTWIFLYIHCTTAICWALMPMRPFNSFLHLCIISFNQKRSTYLSVLMVSLDIILFSFILCMKGEVLAIINSIKIGKISCLVCTSRIE